MSIKMTTQMDWIRKGHASYSKYHPDNFARPDRDGLPSPVKGPAAITQISDIDKKIYGAWGHELCCEKAYGPCETTTRIKDNVTTKVGSNWSKTVMVERGISTMSADVRRLDGRRSCSQMRTRASARSSGCKHAMPPLCK